MAKKDKITHVRAQMKQKLKGLSGRYVRIAAGVIVAVVIFGLGVGVGDGRIAFTSGSMNGSLPSNLNYASVNQVYQLLKQKYNGTLTETQLLDGMKAGLAQSTGDPYTEYFTAAEAKQFSDQLNNSFSGIGAELGADSNGNVEIIAPIAGTPAANAGLKPKDVIATINGASAAGLSPDTAVNKIRGQAGTKVTLGIIRNGTQQLTITITRANITVPSVTTKVLPGNIGYMQITSFSNDTANLAAKAAQSFKDAGVKKVILDLRGNPGGLLTAAVSVSSLWLPEGKTVVTERGTYGDEVSTATGNDILAGVPTVVLVDAGSASASEITAGALHDNDAAYLIGVKTFGKGIVQQLIDFNDGSELKVTIASWYRPNGKNINKQGITPDQIVTLSDADKKAGNDSQLTAAEAYLNK